MHGGFRRYRARSRQSATGPIPDSFDGERRRLILGRLKTGRFWAAERGKQTCLQQRVGVEGSGAPCASARAAALFRRCFSGRRRRDECQLEADGTIRSRDALAWFAQRMAAGADEARVAETWWNIGSSILGGPHGSRSSLFVNQHTGVHMRKILEAMNASGMFGRILESSPDMLSQEKRDSICQTLIRTAVNNWDAESASFDFEMRGEICKASLRDTWNDNVELSVRVEIGKCDL